MAKNKRKRRKAMDPVLAFINAKSYHLIAQILDQWPTCKSMLVWPIISLEAFCLELHIKALLRARKRWPSGRNHEPDTLFGELSNADRRRVETHYNAIVVNHPHYQDFATKGVPFDLQSVLMRARKLYVNARYWHEGKPVSTDSLKFGSNAGVGSVSDAIAKTIFEIQPDWRGKLHGFRLTINGALLPT